MLFNFSVVLFLQRVKAEKNLFYSTRICLNLNYLHKITEAVTAEEIEL